MEWGGYQKGKGSFIRYSYQCHLMENNRQSWGGGVIGYGSLDNICVSVSVLVGGEVGNDEGVVSE